MDLPTINQIHCKVLSKYGIESTSIVTSIKYKVNTYWTGIHIPIFPQVYLNEYHLYFDIYNFHIWTCTQLACFINYLGTYACNAVIPWWRGDWRNVSSICTFFQKTQLVKSASKFERAGGLFIFCNKEETIISWILWVHLLFKIESFFTKKVN